MIDVTGLHFSVGAFALHDLDLRVEPGEYFVLLGKSGSGKTMLLECLCGLNRIERGRIRLDEQDVTDLEPRHRGIGYVPQDYVLFPHKTVQQNILFGLQNGCTPRAAVWLTVDQLIDQLDLGHLVHRLPRGLSGGEKQRVALARALAVGPHVLLLDEPVSALDEQARDRLCRDLKHLQQTTRTTTIHVCHNFVEMLSVADRVGVMHDGQILQVGTPQEVLQRPLNTIVARSVQAGANLFPARAQADGDRLKLTGPGGVALLAKRCQEPFSLADVPAEEEHTRAKKVPDTFLRDVTVMIREENIQLTSGPGQSTTPGESSLSGVVRHITDLGPLVRVAVACGPQLELTASLGKREFSGDDLTPGKPVRMSIAAEHVHVMAE